MPIPVALAILAEVIGEEVARSVANDVDVPLPISSHVISGASYNGNRELALTFPEGSYRYTQVPATVVLALVSASSPTAYFNASIRDSFSFDRE